MHPATQTAPDTQEALARLLSHDLRAPLGPLVLAVSTLADDDTLDQGAREMARMALAQCDRMTRLLQASLWALRAPDVNAVAVDLGAVVRSAAGSLEEVGCTCDARILGDVRAIADEQRVRDALTGLLEVAGGARGHAVAEVHLDGGRVVVAIRGDDAVPEPPGGAPADARAALVLGARACLVACGGGLTLGGEEVVAWLPAA